MLRNKFWDSAGWSGRIMLVWVTAFTPDSRDVLKMHYFTFHLFPMSYITQDEEQANAMSVCR